MKQHDGQFLRLLVALTPLALTALACNLLSPIDTSRNLEVTGGGSIAMGESQTATLGSIVEAHDWTFNGEAEQVIHVIVEGEDRIDPRITLLDSTGEVLATANDNEGPDEILSYTLPANGIYTLRVDAFHKGTYAITVE
jgi:hypothetical protein